MYAEENIDSTACAGVHTGRQKQLNHSGLLGKKKKRRRRRRR